MTSAARLKANRENARFSTGPKSLAGKARAARNAACHGLSIPIRSDPTCAAQINALAHRLAGPLASAALMSRAYALAEAQVDVERVRRWHRHLVERYQSRAVERDRQRGPQSAIKAAGGTETEPSVLSDLIAETGALSRYEQRALARRNKFSVAFDAARIIERACRRPE